MSIHKASCHCGNLKLEYQTDKPIISRRCACDFCARQNGLYTSDPGGSIALSIQDEDRVTRYRFGTGQADFLICATCGTFMGALAEVDGSKRMVLNLNTLDDEFTEQPADTHDYDGEEAASRSSRWAERWTPVR